MTSRKGLRIPTARPESPSWPRAFIVAAAWALALAIASAAAIVHEEQTIATDPAFDRVMRQMRYAFLLAPVLTGALHRSLRILGAMVLSSFLGWAMCEWFGDMAYERIGGGP